MGKDSRRKDKRRNDLTNQPIVPPSPPKNKRPSFKDVIAIGGTIVGLILAVTHWDDIKQIFRSVSQKQVHEKFYTGKLNPEKTENYTPVDREYYLDSLLNAPNKGPQIKGILLKDSIRHGGLVVSFESNQFEADSLQMATGRAAFENNMMFCEATHIVFAMKDRRVYISLEIKSIVNDETLAIIEFNHWKLFKDNLLRFKNDDERLEVRDRHDNVALALKYVGSSTIEISGYFIGSVSVLVLGKDKTLQSDSTCFWKKSPIWRVDAEKRIQSIHSIFSAEEWNKGL
jgi:hypothetical protein